MSRPSVISRSFISGGHNFYAGNPLDRVAARRGDETFISGILRDPETLLVPVWRDMHLLRAGGESGADAAQRLALPPLGALGETGTAALADRPWVLLGLWDGRGVVALDLGETDTPSDLCAALESEGARFQSLRQAAVSLADPEAAILAQAAALVNWRRRHLFCGACCGACRPFDAGHVMRCGACGGQHFPRTDPAVIMRVTRGAHILLARGIRFQNARRFSVLAGFVEPGESLEEAVARELREEVGVDAQSIRYHSSQPWPFPGNLMVGFTAETADEAIAIDPEEIVEARWFTRDEVRIPGANGFELPQRDSIARRLIDEWLDAEDLDS